MWFLWLLLSFTIQQCTPQFIFSEKKDISYQIGEHYKTVIAYLLIFLVSLKLGRNREIILTTTLIFLQCHWSFTNEVQLLFGTIWHNRSRYRESVLFTDNKLLYWFKIWTAGIFLSDAQTQMLAFNETMASAGLDQFHLSPAILQPTSKDSLAIWNERK